MFSQSELDSMRQTQEAHMMDTCVIYRVISKEKDKRGMYHKTLDQGTESICGIQMDVYSKYLGNEMQISTTDVDAVLRLPHGVTVRPEDEIEIIKRFGADVPPRRYEVQRFTAEGPSGGRVYLKVRTVL